MYFHFENFENLQSDFGRSRSRRSQRASGAHPAKTGGALSLERVTQGEITKAGYDNGQLLELLYRLCEDQRPLTIVNVATITGITTGIALNTTTTTSLVMNPASSGKVFKINSIVVANVDGSSAADVTLGYHNGSSTFNIAKVVTVPAKTTLVAVDKNAAIYLEEGCQLRGGASANSDLEAIITYEEIS